MKSETLVRRAEQIHLGEGRYLDARAIEMEWFGVDEESDLDDDDEMETLAILRFEVTSDEYVELARLGMVDSVPGGDDEDRSARVAFRTDRDLLDEADETLADEWAESLEDAGSELTIWTDLDYWEVHSID
jgi:hypothetical protein